MLAMWRCTHTSSSIVKLNILEELQILIGGKLPLVAGMVDYWSEHCSFWWV